MIDLDKTCTVCGGWVADYGPEYGWMHIVSQYDNAPHDVVLAGEAESKRQDHLPECPLSGTCENNDEHDSRDMPDWCQVCDQRCICDELRACEQRIKTHEGCADAERIEGYSDGYTDGLAAAREAVAAAYDDERYGHKDDWGVPVVYKDLMLAAIDALREKP